MPAFTETAVARHTSDSSAEEYLHSKSDNPFLWYFDVQVDRTKKLTTFNIWQSYSSHTASCPSICCTAFNKSSRSIPESIEALHPMRQKMLKHLHDFGPGGCCTYDVMIYREMGSNSFNVYAWTVCVHIFKYINYIVCVCACCHAYKYTFSYTYAYACTYAHTHRYTKTYIHIWIYT